MNLLTAFHYVFTADTKGLDKNVDAADRKTKSLTKDLTDAEKATQNLTNGMRGFMVQLAQAAGLVVSAGAIVKSLSGAAAYVADLQKTAMILRVSVSDLDAWGAAAERAGGSVDGMYGAIRSLNDGMRSFRMTGGGDMAWILNSLGIRLRDTSGKIKEPLALLPQLAERLKGVSEFRAIAIGKALGFDDATIQVLRQGGAALDELVARQKSLGVVTEKDTKITKAFFDQLNDTGRIFKRLSMDANQTILPMLTYVLRKFEDIGRWVRENETLISAFVFGVASVITAVYLPAMTRAAIATAIVFAPFLLAAAAIAAAGALIALVAEDIVIFLEGGDSLLGKLLEKFPTLRKDLEAMWEGLKIVWKALKTIGESLLDLFVEIVNRVGTAIGNVGEAIKLLFAGIWEIVKKVWDTIGDVGAAIASFFGGGASKEIRATMSTAIGQMTPVAATGLGAISSGAINNSRNIASSQTKNITVKDITINTQATDADGIAAQIGTSLQTRIEQTNDHFDDGVAM